MCFKQPPMLDLGDPVLPASLLAIPTFLLPANSAVGIFLPPVLYHSTRPAATATLSCKSSHLAGGTWS